MHKKITVILACGLADAILMSCAALVGNILVYKLSPGSDKLAMFTGMLMAVFTAVYIRFNHSIRPL